MSNLRPLRRVVQAASLVIAVAILASPAVAEDVQTPAKPKEIITVPIKSLGTPDDPTRVDTPADMRPYRVSIPGTEASFVMIPVPGGTYTIGSPDGEDDAQPAVKVKVDPFWIGQYEVTWAEYEIWNHDLDIQRRKVLKLVPTPLDAAADVVTRPTPPYTDMTFNSGKEGYPAISMTQLAAKVYCQWLSTKVGQYYRLPTEAEWEFACRAGTTTAFSFGDDASKLGEYGWFEDNCGEDREVNYQLVGKKKPNPWGLYDMHGNVAEWCLDGYTEDRYQRLAAEAKANGGVADNPIHIATELYPRVVRGGSWYVDADGCRSFARGFSEDWWKIQDPQLPKSVWYHTDATFVGFRIIRPFRVPTEKERKAKHLDPTIPKEARTKNAGR